MQDEIRRLNLIIKQQKDELKRVEVQMLKLKKDKMAMQKENTDLMLALKAEKILKPKK